MRIAIVTDWLTTDGGAEKVLSAIIELYPDADIFTLVDFLSKEERENILLGKNTTTSFIQKIPFSKQYFRYYLALFPLAIESLNLKSYDLIISSSWAVAKGIKKHERQLHICYCHTPIRYAWDMYDEYTQNLSFIKKKLVQASLKYIRAWDFKTTHRVDYFIANSTFVGNRILKTYQREYIVIHPPVDTANYALCEKKENYYITASRLVPYKKTRLIVQAFNEIGKKLIVIGDGEELDNIKQIACSNVDVLGYVEKKQLTHYLQHAKAYVYVALEDFGIAPVEALACGTPVIAYGAGGILDTVTDKKHGYLYHEQTATSIIDAIKDFEKLHFDYKYISNYAKMFSKKRFQDEFKSFVNQCIKERDV